MKGSCERIRRILALEKPDRAPLFDLLPNDAVLTHFGGGRAVAPGDDTAGAKAISEAVDGTRWAAFSPTKEYIERLDDGREIRHERWTTWTEPLAEVSSEEYRQRKSEELAGWQERVQESTNTTNDVWYRRHLKMRAAFSDDFFFLLYTPSPGLMDIWREYGLANFSYILYDCEDLVIEQLERNSAYACRWAECLPAEDPFEMIFIGEDIAFKSGPLIDPKWTRKHYFPRLKQVVDAFHTRGKKVMFHSDGNLNAIMDDLVEAGIDVLNPIEVLAGMDLADLHRRYPRLIFAGGIDVSHLLPFGTPQQVRDAVVKAIEDTEGRILVGSSTELSDCVPLENFLAMRVAAMEYRY